MPPPGWQIAGLDHLIGHLQAEFVFDHIDKIGERHPS
jgi:hypothetical protein